jgi:hypothetical protein
LQGLIQLAAALLKTRLRSLEGATRLSEKALRNIALAAQTKPVLYGLDVVRAREEFMNYFRPLSWRTLPPLDASVPLLTLAERPKS